MLPSSRAESHHSDRIGFLQALHRLRRKQHRLIIDPEAAFQIRMFAEIIGCRLFIAHPGCKGVNILEPCLCLL